MRRPGFTLIELLTVIIIIAILTAVIAFSYTNAERTSRDAQRLSDISLIAQAIDQSTNYLRGSLPRLSGSQSGLPVMCADALDSNSANEINDSLFGSHKIPTDPFPSDTSLTGASCTFASNGYLYVLPYMNNDAVKVNRTYILEVGLENTDVTSEAQFTSFTSAGLTSPNTYRNYYVLYGPAVPAS